MATLDTATDQQTLSIQSPVAETAANWLIPGPIKGYRVLRRISVGGMGEVYEAEQERPHRIVALKLIRADIANLDGVRRFEQESELLGRLQHPGIAQIYEAGAVRGQPFFTMEFIRGQRLDEYANGQDLNTCQRLALMIKICDAVEHAHRRGIIHRDLKPANILVNEVGQPKILDFGVARVIGGHSEMPRPTTPGRLLGTLPYMSPEQLRGDPLEIDARTDVYALGVNLYELLTGRLPYIGGSLEEVVHLISDGNPVPLSSINSKYAGDIETIVAKAMGKERARRYGSVAELANDISYHLASLPIIARPPSTRYQLQKFAGRHKAIVTSVCAVLMAVTAGTAVSTTVAARAKRAERIAAHERDRAITAEQKARMLHNDLAEKEVEITQLETYAKRLAPGLDLLEKPWRNLSKVVQGLMWPTSGRLLEPFGARTDPFSAEGSFHKGVDIGAPKDAPVYATADGVAVFSDFDDGYGNLVVLDHGRGFQTYYAHLSRAVVGVGQNVRRGDPIGLVGGSGRVALPHLHYEMHLRDTPVNPYSYFQDAIVSVKREAAIASDK